MSNVLRLDGTSEPYAKIRTQEEIKARKKSSFVNPFKKKYIPMSSSNTNSDNSTMYYRYNGSRNYQYDSIRSSGNTSRYTQNYQPNLCYLLLSLIHI